MPSYFSKAIKDKIWKPLVKKDILVNIPNIQTA